MAKLKDMRFLVQPNVKNCPSFMIDKALLLAARELMNISHIWHNSYPISTAVDSPSYPLNIRAIYPDADFVRVMYVYRDSDPCPLSAISKAAVLRLGKGTPKAYNSDDGAYLRVGPVPDKVYNLDVICALKLRLADPAAELEFPDSVMAQAGEGIANGAAAQLMMQPGNTWTDTATAAVKQIEFEAKAYELRAQVDGLFVQVSTRAQPLVSWTGR